MSNADFQRSLSALHAGNLKESERLLQAVVRAEPKHIEALNLLGVVLGRLGRNKEAVASYDRAIAIAPQSTEAWYGRGMTLLAAGRPEEAISSFDRVLAGKPDFAQVHLLRAKLLTDLGRHGAALEGIEKLLSMKPDFAEGWLGRSIILTELKRYEDALPAVERALALKSNLIEAWHGRGNVLNTLKRHDEALGAYDNALALNPNFAGAWHGRGIVLDELKRYQEALASYDKALGLVPGFTEAWLGRGNVLVALNREEEALTALDRALALNRNLSEAWLGRGNAFTGLARVDDALASYDKAIELDPDFDTAYFNRAREKLLAGRFAEAWTDYERRWGAKDFPSKLPGLNVPAWQGKDLSGRHLLIYWEQGLGDIIQFVRYLPILAERGCKITFLAPAKLVRLFRRSFPAVNFVSALQDVRAIDFQIALMSLPHRLATELSSIPNKVPYLSAEPELATRWREQIGADGLKIGIAWQGNPAGKIDEGRSIPAKEFVHLARMPGIRLISLQKHVGLDQLAGLPKDVRIETFGENFDNGPDAFIDAAAVMSGLDLIITSDTSIAHLAGALGRPTWVALKRVPDWRWLLDREDSPWYPTMRLFRQPQPGAWNAVFTKIERELRALSAETQT
jgi:tetratricopeptide (TPR) repeat protein